MKLNSLATLAGFSALISGSVARSGHRFRASDGEDPIQERSRVTAFVNTDEGLKVECWEIGSLLPDAQKTRTSGSKEAFRQLSLGQGIDVRLFSFAPGSTIFSSGTSAIHSNAVDFTDGPLLFTVKDGLIFIETHGAAGQNDVKAENSGRGDYVFADTNGDDWFYFEDTSSSSSRAQCAQTTKAREDIVVRTISGSDTSLINFAYDRTPSHKVLHEGRCNFAGLRPIDPSAKSDPDAGKLRYQSQEF